MNPINLVIQVVNKASPVIAQITKAVTDLTTNVTAIGANATKGIQTAVTAIANNVNKQLTPLAASISTAFGNAIGSASKAFNNMATAASTAATAIQKQLTNLGASVSGGLGTAIGNASKAFNNMVAAANSAGTSIGKTLSPLAGKISGVFSPIAKTVGGVFSGIAAKAQSAGSSIAGAMSPAINAITSAMGQLTSKVGSSGGGGSGGGAGGGFFNVLTRGFEFASKHFLILQASIQQVQAKISQAFDLFIGQNERLNQSILQAQSSLVNSNRVFKDGLEIKDTKKAIEALGPVMRNALDQIAKDSLELVGVTSGQLNELFNILLQNSQNLANQSKKGLADSVDAATKLTSDFAAAIGVIMGGDLGQARQEIQSILAGTIDMNSTIAKSVGITNDMVASWKQQGVLVDKLREKLQPYLAGNAIAARSIGGITSNMQEMLEIITRKAGQPLFEKWIDVLDAVYKYLDKNKETFQDLADQSVKLVLDIGGKIEEAFNALKPFLSALAEGLGSVAIAVFKGLGSAIMAVIAVVAKLLEAFSPVLTVIGQLIKLIGQGLNTPLGQMVIQIGAVVAAFVALVPVVAPVIATITGVVGAIGAFVSAAGGIGAAIGTIGPMLGLFGPILGGVAAAAVAAAAPFAPLIAVIAAVGVTVSALMPTLKLLPELIGNLVDWIGGRLHDAMTALISVFKPVTKAIEDFTNSIKDKLRPVLATLAPVFEPILNILRSLWDLITDSQFLQLTLQAAALTSALVALTPVFLAVVGAVSGFIASIGAAVAAAGGLGAILGGVATTVGTFASGGIPALVGALTGAIPALTAFGAAAAAALAPLLPIIALGGAITVTLVWVKAKEMEVANEEIETFYHLTEGLGDQAIATAEKLKVLNDKKKAGAKLTKEEEAEYKRLNRTSQATVAGLEENIKGLKELTPATEEQRNAIEAQIATSERMIKVLASQAQGVKLLGKEIPILGDEFKQLKEKAEAALKALEKPEGDSATYEAKAQELIQLTQRQLQLGQITKEEALKRFQAVADNARLSADTQIAAEEQITAAKTAANEQEVADLQAKQGQIQSFIKAGLVSQAQGEKELTETKLAETKKRLKFISSEILREDLAGRGNGERRKQLRQQELQLQNEFMSTEADGLEQRRQQRLKDFEEQLSITKSQNDQKLLTESEFNKKTLDATIAQGEEELKQIAEKRKLLSAKDKEGLEALAVQEQQVRAKMAQARDQFLQNELKTKLDHNQRLLTIEQGKLDQLLISSEEFNQKSYNLTKKRIADELAALEKEKELLPKSGKAREEGLEKIAAKEAEIRGRSAKADREFLQNQLKIRLEHYDRLAQIAQASLDRDLISTEEYNQKSLNLSRKRVSEELKSIEKERALIPKTGKGRIEALEKLAAREAEVRAKGYKAEKEFLQNQLKARTDHYDRLTQIAQANLDAQLISSGEFNQKAIELTRKRIAEEVKALEKEKALIPKTGSGRLEALEKIAVREAELRAKAFKAEQEFLENQLKSRQEHYERRSQLLQDQQQMELLTSEEFAAKSLDIERKKAGEELQFIEAQRKRINSSGMSEKARVAALEKLAVQESGIKAKLFKQEKDLLQAQLQARLDHIDRISQINQANYDQQLMTASEFAAKNLEIEKRRFAEEQAAAEKERRRIESSGMSGNAKIEALEKLAVKEAQARARIFKAEQEFNNARLKAQTDHYDRMQALEKAQFDQRQITEVQFARRSLEISKQRAGAELADIERQRQSLKATGAARVEALEKLAVQEAQIHARIWQEQENLIDKQRDETLHKLQTAQKKASDVILQAEADRQIAQQRLIMNGQMRREDLQRHELQATRIRIKEELRAEEEKLMVLASLPRYSDPKREEQHQSEIRESRRRTSELTLSLLKNEEAMQAEVREKMNRELDKHIKQVENSVKKQTANYENYLKLLDSVGKSYENQNKLLDAQQQLRNALSNALQGEYNFLINTAKTETEKNKLIKDASDAKLAALKQQQEYERQSLELQIKQNQLAEKRLEIENQIATAKAKVDLAREQAALQKMQRDPNARQEEIEAQKQVISGTFSQLESLNKLGQQLQDDKKIKEFLNQTQRTLLNSQQRSQNFNARVDAANAETDPVKKEAMLNALRNESYNSIRTFGGLGQPLDSSFSGGVTVRTGAEVAQKDVLMYQNLLKQMSPSDPNRATTEFFLQKAIEKAGGGAGSYGTLSNLQSQASQASSMLNEIVGKTETLAQGAEQYKSFANKENTKMEADLESRWIALTEAQRKDPEYQKQFKMEQDQIKQYQSVIAKEQENAKLDKQQISKEGDLLKQDSSLLKREDQLLNRREALFRQEARAMSASRVVGTSISSPSPSLKINVPSSNGLSGMNEAQFFGRIIQEVVKLQKITETKPSPIVTQKFDQTNYLNPGDTSNGRVADASADLWKKGMFNFIEALGRT